MGSYSSGTMPFQCIMPHFDPSHCWFVATSAVCCFDWIFFPDDNLVWGKNFAGIFFFVSGQEGLHEEAGLREDIRMLMADVLPKCIAGSFGVHRSTICCHSHRLCETRKNNDHLR